MKSKFKDFIYIIISLFVGCMCTVLFFNKNDLLERENDRLIKEINIKESESISSSIDKIYDAVVVVQTYNDNKLIGTGTGFYYKKNKSFGYIITNNHVIEDGDEIVVIGNDDVEYNAKILGRDEYLDLAVLQVNSKYANTIAKIGDSSKVNIGDTVFTVGTPMGIKYKGTVTKGILSGKNRQVTVNLSNGKFIMDVLQTDAAINPGNSGGPLVNINGEVIGVTSLKLVEDEIEGMGFALPIESVINSLDKLEKGEEIKRPLLGIQMVDIENNSIKLKKYGINVDEKIKKGVVVIKVDEGSCAEKAKLEVGDIITKINNDIINDTAHFRYNLYKYEVGDIISITYIRDGKENNIKIKLTDKL